jgi:peroxiredoxin
VQVPGYLSKAAELKEKGVDEMLVYCVNEGAVMKGGAKDQGIEGSLITFLADTSCKFTRKIGMAMSHKGPKEALGGIRCKRFVLIVENGTVKNVEISEAEDDPAGDNDPEGPITAKTRVEHILTLL